MNRLFVVTGLVILIVALVFINQGIKKAGVPDHDEDAPPPAAKSAPAAPVKLPSTIANDLPAEQAVGNPVAAKHHITVGWSYSNASQQKPETLTAPIKAIQDYAQETGSRVSVEVVNTEVPASDRSPAARSVTGNGVFVDGKPVFKGDVSSASPQQIVGAIQAATK